MKIVQTTHVLEERFGIEKALEMIAEAGFDGYDFSAFNMLDQNEDIDPTSVLNGPEYMTWAKNVKTKADSLGIKCYQAHAPFPSSKYDEKFNKEIKQVIIRSMEIAAYLGAEIIVVHPIQHLPYNANVEKLYELNMEFYKELIPYCKEFGIKVATENMWHFDFNRNVCLDSVCTDGREFNKYVDDLNSEYITACLDIGHCGLCGRTAQDMLRILGGKRIGCLHIHDTDNVHDNHTLPCTMDLDWTDICKTIAEIGYKGHFTFEADNFLRKYDEDDFIPTALKYMADTAKYLVRKIERFAAEI